MGTFKEDVLLACFLVYIDCKFVMCCCDLDVLKGAFDGRVVCDEEVCK